MEQVQKQWEKTPLITQPLGRIAVKWSPQFCRIVEQRLKDRNPERGLNMLMQGGVHFKLSSVESAQGSEFYFELADDANSEPELLPWNPDNAYSNPHGKHNFYFEGFVKKAKANGIDALLRNHLKCKDIREWMK